MCIETRDRVESAGHKSDQAAHPNDAAGYLGGFRPEESGGLLGSMESYRVGASTAIPAFS